MQKRLPKYRRTAESFEKFSHARLTERDLQIVAHLAFYRLLPTSLLVRLVGGDPRTTCEHLQKLYHQRILDRFTIPQPVGRNPGEFIYVIQNVVALDWLVEHGWAETEQLDYSEVRYNRERPYSNLSDPYKAEEAQGRLLYLKHELMISRFHAILELACKASEGAVELADWQQGAALFQSVAVPKMTFDKGRDLWGEQAAQEQLPHRPDAFFSLRFPKREPGAAEAHFFYEADRKTTTNHKNITRKLRAHFHYVVKQNLHVTHYGVSRIRAVLIETTTPQWAASLRELAKHPLVSGLKPSPLFWFTPSTLFTEGPKAANNGQAPYFFDNPQIIFARIWATPVDNTLYSLLD
jgi:hypothetical protein